MDQTTTLRIEAPGGAFAEAGARPAPSAPARPGAGRARIVAAFLAYAALVALAAWFGPRMLPDQLSLHLAGHALTLKNIHGKIIGNGALLFLVLPAALWIECVVVGWQASSARQLVLAPSASMKTDLAVLVLGQAHLMDIVGRVMMLGVSMLSGLWIREWLRARFGLAIDPSALPAVAQVAIYFFVYTFFDYWTHRVDHSRWFWPIHRYHHAATDFSVINAGRAHPAAFSAIFLINIPMAVLGAAPMVMIWVNVATIALGFIIHSRIDSNFGWIGRWIIQSPNHHRLHHKLDMSTPTGHFAMAPIWDHLFGTWRGEADQSLVIGVAAPYRHGFWIAPDLARDYWHFWKGFFVRSPDAG